MLEMDMYIVYSAECNKKIGSQSRRQTEMQTGRQAVRLTGRQADI